MSAYDVTQKYYEDLIDEAKKKFENHIATYEKLSDRVSILTWKRPKSSLYMVRYIMDGRNLHISGDLGYAAFDLTWDATPDSFRDIGIHYFEEKLRAYSRDRLIINPEVLKKELDEEFETIIDENEHIDEDSYNELKEVFDTLKGMDEISDIVGYLNHSGAYDVIQQYDLDCWEWIYSIGNVISPNIVYYLVGLQMASLQLSEQK